MYRSGQMTADGFRETIERYHIKTVVNLQHEDPDPMLSDHWLGKPDYPRKRTLQRTRCDLQVAHAGYFAPGNTLTTEPPAVKDWLRDS